MAVSEAFTGTSTIGTTEFSMTTSTAGPDADTTDGWYQAFIECNNMLAGEIFEFVVYEKVLAASTQRRVFSATISGEQSSPIWVSPVIALLHGWDMTIRKVVGTDRSISWSIRKAP